MSAATRRSPPPLPPALAGPIAFAAAAVVGGRLEHDFRHRREPVSALAAHGSPAAPVMVPGFLALGAGTLALASRLRGGALPPSVPVMMAVTGCTTAGAGLFRCSDRSCPARLVGDSDARRSDDLHGVFSMVSFVLWAAMPLTTARYGTRLRPTDRRRSGALGLLTLSAWLGTGALFANRSPWQGAAQRVMLASALSWYPVAAAAATVNG